jgi:hypothetical protein
LVVDVKAFELADDHVDHVQDLDPEMRETGVEIREIVPEGR